MRLVLIAALAVLGCQVAIADGPWKREFQDLKYPTQAALEHYSWAAPALGSGIVLLNAGAASALAPTTFSTFAAQPDYARNIVITPTGVTANVGAGTAVVTGTNIFGKTISENFAIGAAQNTATTGAKAFATVSSVTFPQATGAGVTVHITAGTKLGLPRCSSNAGDYVFSEFGGVYDAVRGTYAPGSSTVESNTFASNSALNGASNVDLFYVQNYLCHP